jgi:hypothetical protein
MTSPDRALAGEWVRSRPRIGVLPRASSGGFDPGARLVAEAKGPGGVRVVGLRNPEPYRVLDALLQPIAALVDLGPRPTAEALQEFVSASGPLVDFGPWAAALSDEEAEEIAAWFVDHGDPDAAEYLSWARQPVPGPARRAAVPEPVALYAWASAHLAELVADLEAGDLGERSRRWLDARLAGTQLWFDGTPGRLTGRATRLLDYLAVQAVLGHGEHGRRRGPEQRACAKCGRSFVAADPRQLYCSQRCRWAAVKRAQRQRRRTRKVDPGEMGDPPPGA